ncbi:MAG: type II secretion system protein [Candidatus Pacebacteria bacterium]|nr:type II secretion system protein [Candidatus Paceibacterota bacterium]
MMKKTAGFTMIELMASMAILAVLIGFSLTLLNPRGQLAKARDVQRKADLDQYSIALEAYATANNSLYTRRNGRQTASSYPCDVLNPIFLANCPSDPGHNPGTAPNDDYRYRTDNPPGCGDPGEPCATQYVLWTYLETGGVWEICSDGRRGKLEINPPALPSDSGGNCEVP